MTAAGVELVSRFAKKCYPTAARTAFVLPRFAPLLALPSVLRVATVSVSLAPCRPIAHALTVGQMSLGHWQGGTA